MCKDALSWLGLSGFSPLRQPKPTLSLTQSSISCLTGFHFSDRIPFSRTPPAPRSPEEPAAPGPHVFSFN